MNEFAHHSALVVDDNRSLRDFIKSYLLTMGFGTVRTAKNGEQATMLLRSQRFDIIVSDAVMPGIDGIDLLTWVRRQPISREVPFIMVSGFPERSAVRAAVNGVTDFIVKPFSYEVFAEKVEASLGKSSKDASKNGTSHGDRRSDGASSSAQAECVEREEENDAQVGHAAQVEIESADAASPIEAVLAAWGAAPVNGFRRLHGKRAGRFVAVHLDDEPLNRKQVDEVLAECLEHRAFSVEILVRQFDCGCLPDVLRYAQNREIELCIRHIVTDREGVITAFTPASHLTVRTQRIGERVSVELSSFVVAEPELQREANRRRRSAASVVVERRGTASAEPSTAANHATAARAAQPWHNLVAFWGVTRNYRGETTQETFQFDWHSLHTGGRTWKSTELAPPARGANLAVCVVDITGNVVIKVLDSECTG